MPLIMLLLLSITFSIGLDAAASIACQSVRMSYRGIWAYALAMTVSHAVMLFASIAVLMASEGLILKILGANSVHNKLLIQELNIAVFGLLGSIFLWRYVTCTLVEKKEEEEAESKSEELISNRSTTTSKSCAASKECIYLFNQIGENLFSTKATKLLSKDFISHNLIRLKALFTATFHPEVFKCSIDAYISGTAIIALLSHVSECKKACAILFIATGVGVMALASGLSIKYFILSGVKRANTKRKAAKDDSINDNLLKKWCCLHSKNRTSFIILHNYLFIASALSFVFLGYLAIKPAVLSINSIFGLIYLEKLSLETLNFATIAAFAYFLMRYFVFRVRGFYEWARQQAVEVMHLF